MPSGHLINRVSILGSGLIGGSFALALRKYTQGIHITVWDRHDVSIQAKTRGLADESFSGELKPAILSADLIYIALPISTTLDHLPEIASHAAPGSLVTDACSTKMRIVHAAEDLFPSGSGPLFLGGHPMAGKELSGIAHAGADLFRDTTYALITGSPPTPEGESRPDSSSESLSLSERSSLLTGESVPDPLSREPRVAAFLKIIEKIGARPLLARRAAARLRGRSGISSSATRRRCTRFFSVRSSR